MKYSVKNNGFGFVEIRLEIPESFLTDAMRFIEGINKTLSIRQLSSSLNEEYFIKLNKSASNFYRASLASGLSVNASISATLSLMKGAAFYNISYDMLKSILSKQGCFRSKCS